MPTIKDYDTCLFSKTSLNVVMPNLDKSGNCACGWNSAQSCACALENNVYNKNISGQLQVCWRNISNNTIIHFFKERLGQLNVPPPVVPISSDIISESYYIVIGGK